ncbi:hypothetical protein QWZ13_12455 [Reinekea marina]|uniref:hypothetical protein n=1 Tax=Reinekea marina TaxID=1310421 RepID=UPI0025B503C4|nr:hypothetical protein [Reinekea marina]MDN3649724.1 hypothetical protein [Reinekea marina]
MTNRKQYCSNGVAILGKNLLMREYSLNICQMKVADYTEVVQKLIGRVNFFNQAVKYALALYSADLYTIARFFGRCSSSCEPQCTRIT